MRILDSTCITGNISKMYETPDNFIINGQIYDKNSISPIPLSFCPLPVSPDNEMILYKTAYVWNSWNKENCMCGYMIDTTDPTSFYSVINSLNGTTSGIYKVTKNSNGSISTKYINISTSYRSLFELIGQDNQNIYFTLNRDYGGSYSFIGYINKITLATGNVNINTGSIKVLKNTDLYIYFATNSVDSDTLNIGKYNKSNNTITWMLKDTSTAWYYDNIVSDLDNGTFYCKKDGKGFGMTDHFMSFRKYKFDFTKDSITSSNVNIDNSAYPSNQILINNGTNMAICNIMFGFTDDITKKKYMNCIVYGRGTLTTVASIPTDSALYTYEMIDESNWKLVSYIKFNPITYKAILPLFNNQTIFAAYENGAHVYVWNSGLSTYQKVSAFDTPIYAIGCDNNNRMFIQYNDKSVELVANVVPTTVLYDFEKEEYPYEDKDILTFVNLGVQNYKGKFVSTTIDLTLFGNCKFTSNGSNTITVTTSTDGIKPVPVTIYGEGNYDVVYSFKN